MSEQLPIPDGMTIINDSLCYMLVRADDHNEHRIVYAAVLITREDADNALIRQYHESVRLQREKEVQRGELSK